MTATTAHDLRTDFAQTMTAARTPEHMRELPAAQLETIARERSRTSPLTKRAGLARAELARRRLAVAAEADLQVAAAALAASGVRSWTVHLHCDTWDQWAGLVEAALDFTTGTSARSLHALDADGGVTVRLPPRRASWSFWPPQDPPMPADLQPLAWRLANALRIPA